MEITYEIIYEVAVVARDIPYLDTRIRKRVRDAVESKLASQPNLFGAALRQSLRGYRKLRVGEYRVIYRIDKKIVRVVAIGKRDTVYKFLAMRL